MSSQKKSIILIGCNLDILELCENSQYQVVGFVDKDRNSGSYNGYPILGNDLSINEIVSQNLTTELFIVSDYPLVRKKLVEFIEPIASYATIVSAESRVSGIGVQIGHGVLLHDGVRVMQNVDIGKFVRINRSCHIAHDSVIGDFTTIAPSAVILGGVILGESCYIGANATLVQHVNVCSNVIVGAGAVVNKDIKEPGTYVGVPAKRIK